MKKITPLIFLMGGFFLFLDQFLKWQARHSWSEPRLLGRFFGWSPFFNDGVAFSLPMPEIVTIVVTVPIIAIVIYFLHKEFLKPVVGGQMARLFGLSCILVGALSNLFDRVMYHTTVDYLRIFTGVINLADVLIVLGFVIYFWALRKQN